MKINPAWIEAGKGPHCDIPGQDFVDAIYQHIYSNSVFLKLMNTDHPDTRRTASEINAMNDAAKSSPRLPAAWLRVEATRNGWGIYIDNAGGPPQFVFNNVFDCARKIVSLLDPEQVNATLESDSIRRLSEGLLVEANRRADAEKALRLTRGDLELMTAGRDQDRGEHSESIQEYQEQLRNACAEIESHKQSADNNRRLRHAAQAALADYRASTSFTGETKACVDGKIYTIDDLCKEHSDLKERVLYREVEITRLKGVVGRLQKIVHNITTKNNDLEADRDVCKKIGEDREKEIHALRIQNADLAENNAQWKGSAEDWRNDNATLTQEIVGLRALVADTVRKLTR
jgi:hypothetical protein